MRKKRGFTLVELLIVITIIGILSSVVLVSSKSAVDKAKKASALTTASSVLPELVTCQDDGGVAANTAPTTAKYICCTTTACDIAFSGHTVKWQDISSTGWNYSGAPTGSLAGGDYQYTIKLVSDSSQVITCSMATNGCV